MKTFPALPRALMDMQMLMSCRAWAVLEDGR
jgi:hypothetical protein